MWKVLVKVVIATLGGINRFKMFSGCGVYIYFIFHSVKTDALYSSSGSSSSSIEGGWCLSLWRGKWSHRERLSCRVLKPANDWLLMMPLGPPGEWVPAAMMSGKREDTPAREQRGFWLRKKASGTDGGRVVFVEWWCWEWPNANVYPKIKNWC